MRIVYVAGAALLAFPTAPVSASTPDPVAAVQRQLVPGRGVKIVEKNTDDISTLTTSGVLAFGKGKVVATDKHWTVDGDYSRDICANGRLYERKSKSRWTGFKDGRRFCFFWLGTPEIDLANPRLFKAILDSTAQTRPGGVYDGVPTTMYTGTITMGELGAVEPHLYGDDLAKCADWVVLWRLWIGKDHLVRRMWVSSDVCGWNGGNGERYSTIEDIRLSGWGSKITVKPPPSSQITWFKLKK